MISPSLNWLNLSQFFSPQAEIYIEASDLSTTTNYFLHLLDFKNSLSEILTMTAHISTECPFGLSIISLI